MVGNDNAVGDSEESESEEELEYEPPGDPEDQDENSDWTFVPNDSSFTDPDLCLSMILQYYENHKDDVLSEICEKDDFIVPPKYFKDFPGKYFKIVRSNATLASDHYQPWSTKAKIQGVTRPSYSTQSSKVNPGIAIKIARVCHRLNPQFKKELVRIIDAPELEEYLFVGYIFSNAHMILPPKSEKGRIDGRSAHMIKRALRTMGVGGAMTNHIPGIPFQPARKQLQNLSRVMSIDKKNRGPIPGTLMDRLFALRESNPDLQIHTVGGGTLNSKTKSGFEALFVCRDGCRTFLADVPTERVLRLHQEKVDSLMDLDPVEHGDFIARMHEGTTPSSTVPRISSFVQADTTFHMSDLYITTIVGVLERFRTKRSKKLRPVILGFVVHHDRKMYHQTNMGKALAAMLESIDPTKRVPATITDGELSLQDLFQGPCFSMATSLRCDVHRKRNIVDKMKSKISPADLNSLCNRLFGRTQPEKLLGTTLIGGVLSNVTKHHFDMDIKKTKARFNNPDIDLAIDSRAESLWKHNSMYYKMRGGIICQWMSTNIIECQNNRMQNMFPRPEGVHSCVERLLKLCKDDIIELWKATVSAKDCLVVVDDDYKDLVKTESNWRTMTCSRKENMMSRFGLPTELAEKDSAIPMWMRQEFSSLDDYIRSCSVYAIPNKLRWVVYKKTKFSGGLAIEGNDMVITCCEEECERRKRVKLEPCFHVATIIANLHRNVAIKYWMYYENNRDSLTAKQIGLLQRKPGQGQKRDGGSRSKHNGVRGLNRVRLNNSAMSDASRRSEGKHRKGKNGKGKPKNGAKSDDMDSEMGDLERSTGADYSQLTDDGDQLIDDQDCGNDGLDAEAGDLEPSAGADYSQWTDDLDADMGDFERSAEDDEYTQSTNDCSEMSVDPNNNYVADNMQDRNSDMDDSSRVVNHINVKKRSARVSIPSGKYNRRRRSLSTSKTRQKTKMPSDRSANVRMRNRSTSTTGGRSVEKRTISNVPRTAVRKAPKTQPTLNQRYDSDDEIEAMGPPRMKRSVEKRTISNVPRTAVRKAPKTQPTQNQRYNSDDEIEAMGPPRVKRKSVTEENEDCGRGKRRKKSVDHFSPQRDRSYNAY